MLVKVGTMPGGISEYALENGSTAGDAVRMADLSIEGYQLQVNSENVSEDKELKDGDLVLLVKQIKGNK